jgi:hypothetical protein
MTLFKKIFLFLTILSAAGCVYHSDPYATFTSTGYIIGFEPCNPYEGKIISLNLSADTVATYTIPKGTYAFPEALFAKRAEFLFADSVAGRYPISITYRLADEFEKQYFACSGSIVWWRPELRMRIQQKQIMILKIKTISNN